jgi:hypothetical protein
MGVPVFQILSLIKVKSLLRLRRSRFRRLLNRRLWTVSCAQHNAEVRLGSMHATDGPRQSLLLMEDERKRSWSRDFNLSGL